MLTQVMGFFLHWVPAYAIDAAVRLFGGKPFLVKIVTKVDAGIKGRYSYDVRKIV